jgi:hypothetical protein
MTSSRLPLLSLILAFALAACAPAAAPHIQDGIGGGNGTTTSSGSSANGTGAPVNVPPADAAKRAAAQNAAAAADRLVIRTATLSMVVADPVASADRISALAASLNGYIVTSNTSEASVDAAGKNIMQASITIRVPSAQLDAALVQIRGLAVTVKSVNITGQDVTAQYTDLQSQLRNAQAAETKLQQIMDSATKTDEVLAVFNQLVVIRGQVEQLQGQIKYFDESAAMSAISVDLIPDALSQPIDVGGWKPQGVVKSALEALLHSFQGLATAAIWIGLYVLPLALVIGLPVYVLVRFLARRVRRPKVVSP